MTATARTPDCFHHHRHATTSRTRETPHANSAYFLEQGPTAGISYPTLTLSTGSARGRAACGKLARRNLAHPAVSSPSSAAPAPRSAAAANLGIGHSARFLEALTAACRRAETCVHGALAVPLRLLCPLQVSCTPFCDNTSTGTGKNIWTGNIYLLRVCPL